MLETGSHRRVLVIEDRPEHMQAAVDLLRDLKCITLKAITGESGVEYAHQEKPDLIVLDEKLPDMQGHDVIRELRANPETNQIPILVLSSYPGEVSALETGADEYVAKSADRALKRARITKLLDRSWASSGGRGILTVGAQHEQRLSIQVTGSAPCDATTRNWVHLPAAEYSRETGNAFASPDWRFQVKQVGKKIHDALFQTELSRVYEYLRGWFRNDPGRLRLRFRCSRTELGLPFELLFDNGVNEDGRWLALAHPMARIMLGRTANHVPLSPDFFSALETHNEPLRILLLGSNTHPEIQGVDREIKWLAENLERIFADEEIDVRPFVVPTGEADIETVKGLLQQCKYHIVHYAGHGRMLKDNTGKSYLKFWQAPGRRGEPLPLTGTELEDLLRQSETRLLYLSCCNGTSSGTATDLHDHDFLGIADAALSAGVPAVLGYRRPVSDDGAEKLAKSFYSALATYKDAELAVFRARRDLHKTMPDDSAWLSPILIQRS